jgi:plastocyanin
MRASFIALIALAAAAAPPAKKVRGATPPTPPVRPTLAQAERPGLGTDGPVVVSDAGATAALVGARLEAPREPRGCAISGTLAFESPSDVTLTRVVVYVSQGQSPGRGAAPEAHVIAQQNQAFVPDVLVIQKNDSVAFPNRDRIEHSVFSTEGTVNIPPSTRAEPEPVAFARAGSFRIQCNIHSNMRADVLVVPNRELATFVTRDGSWRIDGITAQKVTLTAWEPNGGTVTQVVSPCDGRPVALSLKGHRAPTLRMRDGSLFKDYAGP